MQDPEEVIRACQETFERTHSAEAVTIQRLLREADDARQTVELFREALEMPDATIPEMVGRIRQLRETIRIRNLSPAEAVAETESWRLTDDEVEELLA